MVVWPQIWELVIPILVPRLQPRNTLPPRLLPREIVEQLPQYSDYPSLKPNKRLHTTAAPPAAVGTCAADSAEACAFLAHRCLNPTFPSATDVPQ